MTTELTNNDKFLYVQKYKFDIDKCIIEAWDTKQPKDNTIATWQSVEHPELKGTTIPLTNENINKQFGRRFWANLSTSDDSLFNVKFN